ncbi:CRAL-TRIO domain-containing protein, partial [Dichotomocladium elegans]
NKNAAEAQFTKSYKWRKTNEIDLLPCATRQNKLPLLVAVRGFSSIDDGNLEAKPGVSRAELCRDVPVEAISLYQTACNEFLNRVIMPECSVRAGKTIFKETVIFDCHHMGVRQFQMGALHYLKAVVDIIQAYYPETLHRMYIVNAPAVLHTIWKIIKPWLEQRTADKVTILSHSETPKVLLEYIAPENLPSFLGGSCTCEGVPGGCVPSTVMGNVPPLVPFSAEDCEEVVTPYNKEIMEKAKVDNRFRNPT